MKSILEQVYGVELASQKIELGLIEDTNNLAAGVEKLYLDYVKTEDKIKQKGSLLFADYNRTSAKLKELGLDPDRELKEASKMIGKLKMKNLI